MKKNKKKLSLDKFKIAKLSGTHSIWGGDPTDTVTVNHSDQCHNDTSDQTNDPGKKSTLLCIEESIGINPSRN